MFHTAMKTKNCKVMIRIHMENSVFWKKKSRTISQTEIATPTLLAVSALSSSSSNYTSVNYGLNVMTVFHEDSSSDLPVSSSMNYSGTLNLTIRLSGSLKSEEIAFAS